MNGILEKIGSYQILTNLLPGAFFGLTLKLFFRLGLKTDNISEDVLAYYFVGIIINRIGSIAVEPILKKLCFIKYVPYPEFARAVKADSKIDTLSEMNNYIRSLLTSVLLLPLIWALHILSLKWTWLSMNWTWCFIVFLILLFLFSYKKQTNYVCKRVNVVSDGKPKDGIASVVDIKR